MSRFICVVCLWLSAGAVWADWAVGVSTADITPHDDHFSNDVFMGGYGLWKERGAATGVHDPLSARAFCIRSSTGICIVIVDSLGLPGPVNQEIARQVGERTGFDTERILVGSTHTHAAPDLLGLWGGAPEGYRAFLIRQTADAVIAALNNLRPAVLSYSTTTGKAYNRRGWSFTDDDIVVLQAVGEDGKIIGTLVNFAAHPVISPSENRLISSDFVHYLRKYGEEKTGAPVVYVNGAIGDVTPMATRNEDYWADARRYGEEIANRSLEALGGKRPVEGEIDFRHREFSVEVDNFTLALAQVLGIVDDFSSGPPWDVEVRTSVARFSLGDQVEAVAVPGEALSRLGIAIKEDMKAPARLFLGLSGGSLGYFVPADEWHTGRNHDYEESVSLGRHMAGRIEDLLKSMR